MVGEKNPLFYNFFLRKLHNNSVYCFLVSISPFLIIVFIPQFAVFSAVLLAPMLESYGFIGTIIAWGAAALWIAPIQILWYRVVRKRMENYVALLVNRRTVDVEAARDFIIDLFKRAKTESPAKTDS